MGRGKALGTVTANGLPTFLLTCAGGASGSCRVREFPQPVPADVVAVFGAYLLQGMDAAQHGRLDCGERSV